MSAGVTIHIDGREVHQLAVDLSGAPMRVQLNASKATRQGARLIHSAMRRDASGHRYLGGLPGSIATEMMGPLSARIGFEVGGQGSLAHIIVKGSVNNAPVYDYTAGPRKATPLIEELYGDAAEESVLGGAR